MRLSAPKECGSAESIRGGVDELVQRAPTEPLRAALTVWRNEDGYLAELRTAAATSRVVKAPSCDAVIEAVTVILALAIDPRADPESVRIRRRGPAPGSAALESREGSYFEIGARSMLDSSTLPHVAAGAALHAGVSSERWAARAVGTFWLPATGSLSTEPSVSGRFSWWTLGVNGCFAHATPNPRYSICLSPELGRLEGTGYGTPLDRTATATWFAVALGEHVAIAINRRLRLHADLGLAVTVLGRHPFVLQRSGVETELHRPGRFSLRGGLGFDVLF